MLGNSASRKDPNWILYFSGDYHCLTGKPNGCSKLFWETLLSCWGTLSPGEIPIGSSTLLEITTILLEDRINVLCSSGKHHRLTGRFCLQGRSQLDLLLFWRLPRSCWKTNKCSVLFWEAPPSCWKTLSPGEIPIGSSTLLEITTILLEDQINVLCSSWKHHRLAGRLCHQGRSQLDLLLFWRLPRSSWKTK